MNSKPLVVAAACTAVVAALIPGVARGASGSFSTIFNPNAPAKSTFDPPPTLPEIAFSLSYDSAAGTLTFSEGGCDDNENDATWYFTGCQEDDFSLSGPTTEVNSHTIGDGPGPGSITVTNVGGSLPPQTTFDGSTVTDVYSSPLLRGLNLDYVGIFQNSDGSSIDNQCDCDTFPEIEQYLPGASPKITITPLRDRTSSYDSFGDVAAPTVQVLGLARADSSYPARPTLSYSGLPPGVSPDRSAGGALDGYLSTPGTYHVRATASATVDGGQRISATTAFTWVVKPAPSRDYLTVPYLGAKSSNLRYKPADIVYTGDGTGQLAGATHKGRRFARLRWTSWTTRAATASGDDWVDNCDPDCATGKFSGYPVRVRLSRPEKIHGVIVFTRLAWSYQRRRPRFGRYRSPRTETERLTYIKGSFYY